MRGGWTLARLRSVLMRTVLMAVAIVTAMNLRMKMLR